MKPKRALLAIAVCAFAVTAAAEIQLTPAGQFRGMDGRPVEVPAWKIDNAIAARLLARHAAQSIKWVIDYEHQSLRAEDNGMPAPASGWFSNLAWRDGAGLFGTGVEWTERAKAMIEAGEYRYISPVFVYHVKTGEVLAIISATLTNTPNLDGMAEVAQRAAARYEHDNPHDYPHLDQLDGDDNVDRTLLATLIAALGLTETAKDADVVTAVTALKASADKLPGVETALAAAKSSIADPGKFVSVDKYNELGAQVAALKATNDARDLADVIDLATGEGRLAVAEAQWATDFAKNHGVAALKESLSKRAPIAALARQQTEGRKPATDPNADLTTAQLAVCRNLGIKPEDYKAQLKAEAAVAA